MKANKWNFVYFYISLLQKMLQAYQVSSWTTAEPSCTQQLLNFNRIYVYTCVHVYFLRRLCDVIKERTFSIVKHFDTLFQLRPHYWKQHTALSTPERVINKIADQRRESLQTSLAQQPQQQQRLQEQPPPTRKMAHPFLDVLLNATLDRRTLTNKEIFEQLSTFMFTEAIYTRGKFFNSKGKIYRGNA